MIRRGKRKTRRGSQQSIQKFVMTQLYIIIFKIIKLYIIERSGVSSPFTSYNKKHIKTKERKKKIKDDDVRLCEKKCACYLVSQK